MDLGNKLGFDVQTDAPASESAYVDVVWYDNRFKFSKPSATQTLLRVAKLPIVGFEIELKTGTNAKHIKGSVTNLDNLGASMGIVVLGNDNLDILRKSTQIHQKKDDKELWEWLLQRVKLWVYAEAKPKTRVVIMTENELLDWVKREEIVQK